MTNTLVSVFQDTFRLRPNVSFTDLARRLTDAWLASSGDPEASAVICRSLKALLKINMVLISIETIGTPSNWRVEFVRKYGIPTRLINSDRLQGSGPLGNSSDMGLLKLDLVEVCQKVMTSGRPLTGRIDQTFENARVIASGTVLPDPNQERAWCVVLGEVHSITMVPRDTRFDDVDISILQLLREGMSARGIGSVLELSPRTVEHRIEKIKAKVGVTSITALTALRS